MTGRGRASTNAAMNETSLDSLIPYDEIVQEALRAVVGRVLTVVEKGGGLPGGHHFYITFKTGAPGIEIPEKQQDTPVLQEWPHSRN